MSETLIKKRCVISIGDYELVDVAQRFLDFQKGLERFAQTWNVKTRVSPFKIEADGAVSVWHAETKAPNWRVNTEFRILNWSDIARKDFRRWSFIRAWHAINALLDFVTSGAGWHYFHANWRFGLFFFYPVIAFSFFVIIALGLASFLGSFDVPLVLVFGFGIAAALFGSFIKWVDPLALPRVVDMWVFMHELVHLERTGLAERLGVFSEDIVAQLQLDNFDEIIIVGHGIGAALQPVIVDRALWALPEFGKDGRSVSLLSLGSLLLAVGLHPAGGWVIAPALRVSLDKMVYWIEYQDQEGIIGFPGRNPVTELIGDHSKPLLQEIEIKNMVDIDPKCRLPESVYQDHQQLVQANSKKYFYDYFMICCGPFALSTRTQRPDHMVTAFNSDGRLTSER